MADDKDTLRVHGYIAQKRSSFADQEMDKLEGQIQELMAKQKRKSEEKTKFFRAKPSAHAGDNSSRLRRKMLISRAISIRESEPDSLEELVFIDFK